MVEGSSSEDSNTRSSCSTEDCKINACEGSSSPLGLTLRKSPSFVNLIQAVLFPKNENPQPESTEQQYDDSDSNPPTLDKMKASNFPATLLRIGNWEKVAWNEGELVAKIYFAKQKIVWEILEASLKNKIEIQWSDIIALRATICNEKPDVLEIELNQPPLFFNETSPQPRRHTVWRAASDFTSRQASTYRRHYVEFPEGNLKKHYEKLLAVDERLRMLSQRPFPSFHNPYFTYDHEMQGFTHRFSVEGGVRLPFMYNHQSAAGLDLSQAQLFGNSLIHAQHFGSPDFSSSSRVPISLHPNMNAAAMNPASSGFQHINGHVPYITTDPISFYPTTISPNLNETNYTLWNQGSQNLGGSNNSVLQLQGTQLTAAEPVNSQPVQQQQQSFTSLFHDQQQSFASTFNESVPNKQQRSFVSIADEEGGVLDGQLEHLQGFEGSGSTEGGEGNFFPSSNDMDSFGDFF